MATARTIDPDVAKQRSIRANAIKAGDHDAAEQAAQDLHEAKILAAARAVAAAMPTLSAEKRARIAALLQPTGGDL